MVLPIPPLPWNHSLKEIFRPRHRQIHTSPCPQAYSSLKERFTKVSSHSPASFPGFTCAFYSHSDQKMHFLVNLGPRLALPGHLCPMVSQEWPIITCSPCTDGKVSRISVINQSSSLNPYQVVVGKFGIEVEPRTVLIWKALHLEIASAVAKIMQTTKVGIAISPIWFSLEWPISVFIIWVSLKVIHTKVGCSAGDIATVVCSLHVPYSTYNSQEKHNCTCQLNPAILL